MTYAPPPPSSAYPSPDWGWETLKPDYSNVRGFNYVPVYPALFDDPPDLPPHLRYYGSASPVATWRFWQPHDVDKQLGYQKGFGCNAVRVFLSNAVWEHEETHRRPGQRNQFLVRFEELVRLCEKHRMYLMPVLFTAYSPIGEDPSPVPYDDIDGWRRSIAIEDTNVAWAREHRLDVFVRQVCATARDSRAIFLWDLGNEPDGNWVEWFAFLAETVRVADPNPAHGITVGFAAYTEFLDNRVVANPLLDVISYHPYGVFRQNIQEWTRQARRAARPPIADRTKPVLATEGGSPGILMAYEDFWAEIRAEGVGFLSWVAVIDDRRGRLPFQFGSGVVYADGEVRDAPAVEALQRFAREDGVLPFQLAPVVVKQDLTGFVEPSWPPGFGIDDAIAALHPLRWPHRPALTDDNFWTGGFIHQRGLLREVAIWGLGILGDVDRPRDLLTPEEQATGRHYFVTFELHDLLLGPQPWLLFDPPRIDWERYFSFMTEWGLELWKIITRHGFAG